MPAKLSVRYKTEYLKTKQIELVEDGANTHSKSKVRCSVCDYIWYASFNRLLYCGCVKCARKIKADKIKEAAYTYCSNKSFKIKTWGGGSTKQSIFECKLCGHEWCNTFKNILHRGQGCAKCYGNAKLNIEDALMFCLTKSFKPIPEEWGGNSNALSSWECQCGCKWKAKFADIKNKGSSCPKCQSKYLYNNKTYDSSWEVIVDIYETKSGKEVIRLEGRRQEYCLEYTLQGKKCKWYPDFLIDGELVEVKPKRGYKNLKLEHIDAKKLAHPKVRWIQDEEIKEMRKVVGDVSKYRQHKVKSNK